MTKKCYENWTAKQLKGFILSEATDWEYGWRPEGDEVGADLEDLVNVVSEGDQVVDCKSVHWTDIYHFTPTNQYFAVDFMEDNVGYWSGESEWYEPYVREVKPVQHMATRWENV
jgi:hypothetical protein